MAKFYFKIQDQEDVLQPDRSFEFQAWKRQRTRPNPFSRRWQLTGSLKERSIVFRLNFRMKTTCR